MTSAINNKLTISTDKTCANCIGYKDGWCQIHKHATRAVNYGCRTHLTEELYKKRMMADIEEVRTIYARYFEKDFVDMMTQYGQSDFDDRQYDNFTADTADFLRLGLTFYEHAYRMPEDKEKAIALIATMPHDLNLFDKEFIDSFKLK